MGCKYEESSCNREAKNGNKWILKSYAVEIKSDRLREHLLNLLVSVTKFGE